MFEVGDKVKCIDRGRFCFPTVGEFYEIIRIDRVGDVALKNRMGFCTNCTYPQEMFVKVKEGPMSKYQEKKEQIESIQAWDKKADDILRELTKGERYIFCIFNCEDHSGRICIYPGGTMKFDPWLKGDALFSEDFFTNQCDKLDTGKRALLWLLDHSDIKKEEREKEIKDLEYQRDTFATQVRSLNLKIEELRR